MDDEHQTNFVLQGAPSGGWHWSALVSTGRWGSRGRPRETGGPTLPTFLLIVQLVVGKHKPCLILN